MEQILNRGERIELLVDKTDNMANQVTAFRRRTVAVRRAQWWKNQKLLMLSVVVGLVRGSRSCLLHIRLMFVLVMKRKQVILWVIVAQFCGAGLNQCGAKSSE